MTDLDVESQILHTRTNDSGARASVTPLYRCSAFEAGSPYFYTRKNNPNIEELEMVIAQLENAKYGIAVACGMAALYAVMDLVQSGGHIVINRDVYGCSFKMVQRVCHQRKIKLSTIDLSLKQNIAKLDESVDLVLFETPTNPFLKTISIKQVADAVKLKNPSALVVVDNTWATSIYQHPLEWGADISLHSGTKYFSGHSDAMNGILLTDREDLAQELKAIRFYGGLVLSPDNAWLVRRSMQTFNIRMRHQSAVTTELRDFLNTLPQVTKVYYPEVDGEQLTGYGGILFFQLREDLVGKYQQLVAELQLFNSGTGMACVESMIAQPYSGSHASMTNEEKEDIGLKPSLVRLCFGLENSDDLKRDLLRAFEVIDN